MSPSTVRRGPRQAWLRAGGARRTILAAGALGLLLSLGGGGGGGEGPDAKGGSSAGEQQKKEKKRKDDCEQLARTIADSIKRTPGSARSGSMKTNLDKLRQLAAADSAATPPLPALPEYARKVDELEVEAAKAYEADLAKRIEETVAEARKLVKDGQEDRALSRLADLLDKASGTSHERTVEKELDRIQGMKRAASRWLQLQTIAEGFMRSEDWDRALGVLESFLLVKAWQESPEAAEAKKMLDEVKPKREEALKRRQTEASLPLLTLFKGDANDMQENWEFENYDLVSVDDEKSLVVKYEDGDEDTVYMRPSIDGSDKWEDYVLYIEFKLEKGSFYINWRGEIVTTGEGDDAEKVRRFRPGWHVTPKEFATGKWHTIHVELRGPEARLVRFDPHAVGRKSAAEVAGDFEVRVDKGTEVHFKKNSVKVVKSAGGAGAGS